MKVFDLETLASLWGGEYVLARKDLHSDACYLIFGKLAEGEGERLIRPGAGYEEILCAVDGRLLMRTAQGEALLERSHAVHVTEHESLFISNPAADPVTYIVAGGRTGS
ncbi:MAG: hypothetical protein FJ118_02150 [Deltaproteobacteria bacterium]|nr:hypothetical protein [Deltaproteobacteria bacterium]